MKNIKNQVVTDRYALYHGDCTDVLRGLPDNSVHYSIFSPPFASLYTYSASPRDLGNCRDSAEFFAHFRYVIPELYRVLKPGRLLSMHCMLLPTSKSRDGFIGLDDFRGDLIRAFKEVGFIFHSEVTIFKDPVQAMQRTKALGLLHKTIRKDASMSRQGIPDYLVTLQKPDVSREVSEVDAWREYATALTRALLPGALVTWRKPGANQEPISHENDALRDVAVWQRYASPVWVTTRGVDDEGFAICTAEQVEGDPASGINPSDTLNFRAAREHDDERHLCALQLEVIRRAVRLWSNPGDVVFSPFGGIGSEPYVAVKEGRFGVSSELKDSYFDQAVRNLAAAVEPPRQRSLFDIEGAA